MRCSARIGHILTEIYPVAPARKHATLLSCSFRLFVLFVVYSRPANYVCADVQFLLFWYLTSMVNLQAPILFLHYGACLTSIERCIKHSIYSSTRFQNTYRCARYRRFLRHVLYREKSLQLSMSNSLSLRDSPRGHRGRRLVRGNVEVL